MTVVAWDGRTLAADKMTSFGGLHATTTKVLRVNGCLVAGCGAAAAIKEMQHWIADGCKPESFPASQRDPEKCTSMLVVTPSGEVQQYESTPYPLTIENPFWAIGSGRDFAIMAMHLGKSARDAVLLTAQLCADCGNGVDALALTELQAVA